MNGIDPKDIITGKGDTLCYDACSGRYFKSDIDKIRKAENMLNKEILTDANLTGADFSQYL